MDYVNVVNIFQPLYIQSRLFGCNLFHLPKSSKANYVSIKALDIILFITNVTLYAWFFCSLVYPQTESDKLLQNIFFRLTGKSGLMVIEFLGHIIFHMVVVANSFTNIMDLINRNKIWKILSGIHHFDMKVNMDYYW